MNWSIVFNILLTIIIIRILLLHWKNDNTPYGSSPAGVSPYGSSYSPYEGFMSSSRHQKQQTARQPQLKEGLAFLTSSGTPTSDLVQYLTSRGKSQAGVNRMNVPAPENAFIDSFGSANFESNVTDPSKYYQINHPTSTPQAAVMQANQGTVNSSAAMSALLPDTPGSSQPWTYKNDLVMNGAEFMRGVTGYDSSGFDAGQGQYNQIQPLALQYEQVNGCPLESGACLGDDIRSGVGLPQRQKNAMNM